VSSDRRTTATVIGLVGGLAVIVGTVLPWVSITTTGSSSGSTVSFPSETAELNGLFVPSAFVFLLGIALGIAAAWLWAGTEPKKAVAALGPLSVGVMTFCAWVVVKKDDAFGYGLGGGPDQQAALEVGVYVTLAGAALALIAAIVAALPGPPVETSQKMSLEDADEPPAAHLDG